MAEVRAAAQHHIDVFSQLIRARTRADLSYRLSFLFRMFSSALIVSLDFIAIYAVMRKVGTIGGWNQRQVVFLYGLSSTSFRLADAFVGGPVERIATHLQNGTFDRFLTRPVGPLTLLCGEEFTIRRIGQLVSCIVVFVAALAYADIAWTPTKAAFLLAVVVSSALLSASIFVVVCCLSFWSPNTQEIANAFTYGSSFAAEYPAHIFDGLIRRITFTIVPSAFTGYVPALILLRDAPNPLGIASWISWSGPLLAIPAVALARFVWRRGLRTYRGTGS